MIPKVVICFAGQPGGGKTYARTHDPELKNAAHIDLADVYHDEPGIDYATAFGEVINLVIQEVDQGRIITVEAMFHPESFQRVWFEMIAEANN
jgi:hypothetical protein